MNELRMSLQACSRLQKNILSKRYNNINNWLNQQPYHLNGKILLQFLFNLCYFQTFAFHKIV